jgi:hypothetical protein
MLRTAVLIFACVTVAIGLFLCATGCAHLGGIQALVGGTVILIGTLFERWRYRNGNAAANGNWQPTGERFVDPGSGQSVEVLYDPESGERRYQPAGERYNRPD